MTYFKQFEILKLITAAITKPQVNISKCKFSQCTQIQYDAFCFYNIYTN